MVQNEKVREEFSQRLARACKNAGLDEHGRGVDIASKLKVSSKAVSKWFNAEALPRQEKMNALADYLKVDVVWLQHGKTMDSSSARDDVEYVGKVRPGLVPVVGDAVLGVDGMIDMVEYRGGWLKIYSDDPNAYGLRVRGDSMWPRIQSGEFVLIEPASTIHPGDEVFVRTSEGHNMIKVLNYTREGEYQFTSINQDHRPITISRGEVQKIEYVAGILKASRHVDNDIVTDSLLLD